MATGTSDFSGDHVQDLTHGIGENREQFLHQLLQVLLVGFALGMMRTVLPALAEAEFGVAPGSFLLLTTFVVAFGVVKGALVGHGRVLICGTCMNARGMGEPDIVHGARRSPMDELAGVTPGTDRVLVF